MELIVALAIFAIAGIAIYGFVSFSTRTFTESNKNVKLQYEQQIVVNRVHDIILETSRGISFDKTTHKLLVFSDNPSYDPSITDVSNPASVKSIITQIRWDETTNTLMIGEFKSNASKLSDITISAENELGNNVTNFEVDLSKLDSGRVTMSITFKTGEKEVTVNPVISLRNMITKVDDETDLDDVYSDIVIPIYSHIAKVEISRDGKIFAQNKVDTIEMAGDSTTAVYTAIVTAKKDYDSSINKECTWTLDTATVKEGYGNCISVTQAGTDADGNSLCNVTVKNSGTKKPADYLQNGYLTIIATSVEDTSRSARLRIKIASGGVYPVSITAAGYDSYTADSQRGLVKYTITHAITYTDKIEDPLNAGSYVNPLNTPSAYSKISYKVMDIVYTGQTPGNALSTMPAGAGFTNTEAVDGIFYAVKSMEEHTFKIRATVTQRNKDGEEVYVDFEISVPKGAIPDIIDSTKPLIRCDDVALRAGTFNASAEWSASAPLYEKNDGTQEQYYYWYEWEIDNNDNACGEWGSSEKNTFNNLYFYNPNSNASNGYAPGSLGQTYTSAQTNRFAKLYCQKYLDWEKTFTFRIKLRVKINKNNNQGGAQYYKQPTADAPDDIMTGNKDEAYCAMMAVTIEPVTLKLSPAYTTENGKEVPVVFYRNKKPIYAVFNHSHTIGLGRSKDKPSNSNDYDNCQDGYSGGYYKIFEPEFTGLYVTIYNIDQIGSLASKINDPNGSVSSLQTYGMVNGRLNYTNETGKSNVWEYNQSASFYAGIDKGFAKIVNGKEVMTNRLYFYIQLFPQVWNTRSPKPDGCVWTCQFVDTSYNNSGRQYYRNSVIATFTDTGKTTSDYAIVYDYGEFNN